MREIIVKRYSDLPYNDRGIRRYLGAKTHDESIENLIKECKKECENVYDLAVCFSAFDIKVNDSQADFGEFKITSKDLATNLKGLSRAIAFVATAGFNIDRLIKKYSMLSPVKALIFSAIGSERVETLCDAFCSDMRISYGKTMARFSLGYGDAPLEAQKQVFKALNVTKLLGVTLNDSLLMSPTKSVSAFIGMGECLDIKNKCDNCANKDCSFRD